MGHISWFDMFHMLHMPRMSSLFSPGLNVLLTALRNNYFLEDPKRAKKLTKIWVRTIVIKPFVYKIPI